MLAVLLELRQGLLCLLLFKRDVRMDETPMALAQRLGLQQCYQILSDKLASMRAPGESDKHMVICLRCKQSNLIILRRNDGLGLHLACANKGHRGSEPSANEHNAHKLL
jgi:hypothetical protein